MGPDYTRSCVSALRQPDFNSHAMAGCCTFLGFRKTNLTVIDRIEWSEERQEEKAIWKVLLYFCKKARRV